MTLSFYNKKKQDSILGDIDFLNEIKEKYIFADQKPDTEISEERKMAGATIAERVIGEVSKSFSKPRQAVMTSKRGQHNLAYFAAISLARELSGLKLPEIAKIFQARSYRTIGTGCYRFKKLLQKSHDLDRRIAKIRQTCSQGEI